MTEAVQAPAKRKDKKQVIDEVWTEARIRAFLDLSPPAGSDADFHRLLRAYQSMRLEDFRVFLGFMVAAGGRLNAAGPRGDTALTVIRQHRYGQPYAEALQAAGAKA